MRIAGCGWAAVALSGTYNEVSIAIATSFCGPVFTCTTFSVLFHVWLPCAGSTWSRVVALDPDAGAPEAPAGASMTDSEATPKTTVAHNAKSRGSAEPVRGMRHSTSRRVLRRERIRRTGPPGCGPS